MRHAAVVLTALLAGCGSGSTIAHSAPPPSHVQTASVTFHIVPTKTPASGARRTKYVSLGTQSARVDISAAGLPTTSTLIRCSYGACTKDIDAPVATDTFTVTLYDDYNAQGNVLSAGTTTQTIVVNHANSVNITFDGTPAHTTALALDVPNPLIGTRTTTNVTVAAVDAAGFTIVGPGVYNPPIQLTLTDPSGSTTLSKTTVNSPTDVVTLSYDGTAKISATLSSGVQGGAVDQTTIFEPANVSAEYAIPNPNASPQDIVRGPDGAMWFAEGGGAGIGRIDGAGSVTEYATTGAPSSIIVGPDGALWFSERGAAKQYGRIAVTDSSVTEYTISASTGTSTAAPAGASNGAAGLAFGADGNLYVADNGSNPGVYVVTPATNALVKTYANLAPNAIASGPDNNIWAGTAGSVTRIRLADGAVSTYGTSGDVSSVAAGTDGNVWFTDRAGKVGKVGPDGAVTEYAVPHYGNDAYKIVAAPDGTYWFTYGHGAHIDGTRPLGASMCRLGHSTAAGSITSYAIADCVTMSLAFGPGQNLWLAEAHLKKIGVFSSF